MKFTVEIGNKEKHQISYSFNKFWGNVNISVDGKTIERDLRTYSLELTKSYQFSVGEKERHDIIIEKIRPLIHAGFRSNTYRIFVDGRLLKEFKD